MLEDTARRIERKKGTGAETSDFSRNQRGKAGVEKTALKMKNSLTLRNTTV